MRGEVIHAARKAAFGPNASLLKVIGWKPVAIGSPSISLTVCSSLHKSGRQEVTHSHQVVSGERRQRCGLDLAQAAKRRAPQQSDALRPAEGLFDQLARLDAQGIATMARCASADRRTAGPLEVLRNVRGDVQLLHVADKAACVVAVIGPQRGMLCGGQILEHLHRRAALGSASGLGDLDCDDQAVAVFTDRVSRICQFRRRAASLLLQPRLRVGCRGIRVVGALLPVEVPHLIAPTGPRRSVRSIFGPETLVRNPCLDHRAIDAEILITEQFGYPSLFRNHIEQLAGNIRSEQPITVLAEHRVIPDRLVDREAHEPLKEREVVLEPLGQHPLAADRIEHLKQPRSGEPLRCNRWSAGLRVQLLELAIHLLKCPGHHRSNRAQWMLRRHPRLERDVAEHPFLLRIWGSHWSALVMPGIIRNLPESSGCSTACYRC